MERVLRYLEREVEKDKLPILDTGENPEAPQPREMVDLEVSGDILYLLRRVAAGLLANLRTTISSKLCRETNKLRVSIEGSISW